MADHDSTDFEVDHVVEADASDRVIVDVTELVAVFDVDSDGDGGTDAVGVSVLVDVRREESVFGAANVRVFVKKVDFDLVSTPERVSVTRKEREKVTMAVCDEVDDTERVALRAPCVLLFVALTVFDVVASPEKDRLRDISDCVRVYRAVALRVTVLVSDKVFDLVSMVHVAENL